MTFDFCTQRVDDLVEWSFNMFDRDKCGELDSDEFKMMIKTVYGKGWRDKADSLEKQLDPKKTGA